MCGYYFLTNAHSGDVAQTIEDLQRAGVNVYRLSSPLTIAGAHRFGNNNINLVQGQGSPMKVGSRGGTLRRDSRHRYEQGRGEGEAGDNGRGERALGQRNLEYRSAPRPLKPRESPGR